MSKLPKSALSIDQSDTFLKKIHQVIFRTSKAIPCLSRTQLDILQMFEAILRTFDQIVDFLQYLLVHQGGN